MTAITPSPRFMSQTAENPIPIYRVRPRFQKTFAQDAATLVALIQAGLSAPGVVCKGEVHETYGYLVLPVSEQHYWSPQLSLTLEEADAGTLLRGIYGPRPALWMMFVFFYSVIGFAATIVGIVGSSRLMMKESAAILWWIPVLVLVFLSLYLVAYFGKQKGYEQMVTLHHFLEDCLGEKISTD